MVFIDIEMTKKNLNKKIKELTAELEHMDLRFLFMKQRLDYQDKVIKTYNEGLGKLSVFDAVCAERDRYAREYNKLISKLQNYDHCANEPKKKK